MLKSAICSRGGMVVPEKPPQPPRLLTKMLLVMRMTVLFLVVGLVNIHANGLSQKVSFSGTNVPLAKVFTAIEKQTGYTVFASKALLRGVKPVTLSMKDAPLSGFLEAALRNQPIDFEINNKTIFIKEKVLTKPEGLSAAIGEDLYIDVKGRVTGTAGAPLEGATVTVKGTSTAVTTDAEGRYSIKADAGQVLVISYIGYQSQEQTVGSTRTINVVLAEASQEMDKVVVTALGISRKTRSLSYNVQEVKNEDLTQVRDGSLLNGLMGKVAGVTINNSAAGPGSSSRVVLRGTKSLSYNNNALYVIDGIPMQNELRSQTEDAFAGAGQTGDYLSNLNPDDIESVSVLSGPSAAALYGSAAANGVVVITTKKGRANYSDVSVMNATTFTSPLILPEFQNTYGVSEIGSYYSWGDKLATPSSYRPIDFFQTGSNATSSISFTTGTDKNQTYMSFGNVAAQGIIPNNSYTRYNFTVRNSSTFFQDKLQLDLSFMSGIINERNMISQGQYFNPLAAVYLFPPGEDFNKVKVFERYDASRNLMTQFWNFGDNGLMMQNPYWVTQRDIFANIKNRYMATAGLKYNLASWINIAARIKMDKGNASDEKRFAAGTNQLFASEYGYYSLYTYDNRQIYSDVLANINKKLSEDYTLTGTLGASIDDINNKQYLYGGKLKGVANLYSYMNIDKAFLDFNQYRPHTQKQSMFGTAQLSYKNSLFADITGRNDWASTLAGFEKKHFFYFSGGVSGVLTDILDIRSRELSYLKVRGSYSEVGNEPPPFLTNPTYRQTSTLPETRGPLPNPGLKPELTKSVELGVNAAFFNNSLKIDATLYHSRTYNQFFDIALSPSSGYTRAVVNGGRVDNKGIELAVRYNARIAGIEWNTNFTYSLNRNKVVEMLPYWLNPLTNTVTSLETLDKPGTGNYRTTLTRGGTMGDIYVNTLKVDEHGAIFVDPGSQAVVADPNAFVFAGTNNPRYNMGWTNNLNWKGFGLNCVVTARVGGVVVSNTQAMMDMFGVSKTSADARDAGGAIVNGRPVPAKEYYQEASKVGSMYVYSATNVRLAELSLNYDLPVKRWTGFIKKANIAFVGRNLFFFYNRAPFDPELTASTQTYFQGIDYFMMPSLRSLGFSLKLNF